MHRGYIKLWRKAVDWEWYRSSETFHLFCHLILHANHKPSRFMGEEIRRGQIVVGRRRLSEETGISEQSIRTSIERLKSTNEITSKSTNKFTIITLCNYESYQDMNTEINQQNPNKSTNDQPATNQQLTTIKECKECKEFNNKSKYLDFVFLTPEEYNRLKREFGQRFLDTCIFRLDAYLANNKKKRREYQDHNKVIRTWVIDEVRKKIAPEPEKERSIPQEDPITPEDKAADEAAKKIFDEQVKKIVNHVSIPKMW
jgi:hypothetical protein